MFGVGGSLHQVHLRLYTDAFIITGTIETRQRRVTDILNQTDDPFLVLADVTSDEFGTIGQTIRSEYAQVNLGSVLFAVADDVIEPLPELRTPKQAETALISIPPFKVTGHIHVLHERSLREALSELQGNFVPVTQATFWSESLKEARTTAQMVAVNHARAQILAPHHEVDPWAGLPGDHDAVTDRPSDDPAEDRADDADGDPPAKESLGW